MIYADFGVCLLDLVDKEEFNIKETKDSVLILGNCILNIVKNSLSAVHP